MTVEVVKGSIYIIFIVKDKDERVLGVLPIKVSDFFKNELKVKEEIKNFLGKYEEVPKVLKFFPHSQRIQKIVNSASFKKLKKNKKCNTLP